MYEKIEGGTIVNIQGLDCNIPPEGYVYNIVTKQLDYVGVYSRSENEADQYWERIKEPDWYFSVIKKWDDYDKKKKDDDEDFYDERLEQYKKQEWGRRLNGFWFKNKGISTYITGLHYLYMQWFSIDIGYPRFRIPDLEYFYFLQYCLEDPDCFGFLEITKRRFGKCFKINTLVRMHDGSVKKIQDIKDGEYVMGNDSKPRLVYGTTTGEEEMYEIIPNKGKSFTVNKSHIIYAQYTQSKNKYVSGVGKIADGVITKPIKFTVEEYLSFSDSKKGALQIERTGWDYDEQPINIDPYFLGIWLGDGSSRNCEISNEDEEIIDYIKDFSIKCGLNYHNYGQRTKKGVMLRHSISQRNSQGLKYKGVEYKTKTDLMVSLGKNKKTPLRGFGLYESGEIELLEYKDNWLWNEMISLGLKNNKHIPTDYKINSRENRLQLLAGILDSDGCLVLKNGVPKYFKLVFSNKYPQLIKDVKELIQSLGFSCNESQASKANATLFTIFGDIHLIPTKVKRKQAEKVERKYNSLLSGFTVKSVGVDKYYGFAVDDNHLFLLEDGTIVHNTFRGGVFVLDYITRTKMTQGTIQSKSGADAKKVFSKAIVNPFRRFPKFFRPEYDTSLGVNPKSEMRFEKTNVRGKGANDNIGKEELGSSIMWYSADPLAQDGQKVHRGFQDEWAKTEECDIYERHEVLRYCLLDDEGNIIGKLLYSSTVEKLDTEKSGVQDGAKRLWDSSDHLKKGANGRTESGLYRFFMSAKRAKNFDIYGFGNEEKTLKEILADRETVKNNPRALSARIRKEPLTIEEAFMSDSDKCIFNTINIGRRKQYLKENPIYKRKVLFYRDIDQTVKWRDATDKEEEFHWKITQFPDNGEQNKFIIYDKQRRPARIKDGAIAVDGYSNSQGGAKWGSRASAWIGRRYDILNPHNTGKAIGWLYGRPAVKETLHEQILLAAEYYGYQVWYEHNSDDYLSYFKDRGRLLYLGLYPVSTIDPNKRTDAERHKGFPTTPFSLVKQTDVGLMYFENYIDQIDFIELLEDAERFDPNNRTEFDITVSFLMLLVCLMEAVKEIKKPSAPLIQTYPTAHAV